MQGPSAHKLLGTEISPEGIREIRMDQRRQRQRKVKVFSVFPLFYYLWAGFRKLRGRGTRESKGVTVCQIIEFMRNYDTLWATINAFELWCWRRLLRVPWTARRSNQSILKEISPGISLEGLMLKLKLQYFVHLMWRVDSLEKTDAGRDWGQEEKGMTEDEMVGWHHQLNGGEFEWTPGVGDGQGGLACCDSWGRKESDMTERLNWTELRFCHSFSSKEQTSFNFLATVTVCSDFGAHENKICHFALFPHLVPMKW